MKKITFILSFFTILFALNVTAQTPNWQWATSGTNTGQEFVNRMFTDNAGNIVVSGVYIAPMTLDGTTVTVQANNLGAPGFAGSDFFIAKYNSSGNLLWVVYPSGSVGTNGAAQLSDMKVDPSSGNIFACMSVSRIDPGAGTIIGNDTIYSSYSLLKFDPSGNLNWHADWEDQLGGKLAPDNSGNVYLTAMFSGFGPGMSSATFDTVTVTNPHPAAFGEVLIIKFNSSGSALWGKTAGGTGSDFADEIFTDNAGNFYISGRYKSDSMYFDASTYVLGTTPPAPVGSPEDYFYAKYDTNGNLIWAKNILLGNMGYVPNGIFLQPALNTNSELFFAGRNIASSLAIGSLTLNSPGYFVTKMDVNGDPVWATVIGDSLTSNPVDLQLDGFGNLFVLGTFNSDSTMMANTWLYNVSPGSGTRDLFVAMVDANGGLISAFKEGGDDGETAAFAINANNSMYLSGSFKSNALTLGSNTLNNPNFPNQHMFLTYSTPILSGLNDMEFSDNFSIYPNPAGTEINLQIKNISTAPTTVLILNTLGETVYSKVIANELNSAIDVSNLSSGVYMLQVQNQTSLASAKFIKY